MRIDSIAVKHLWRRKTKSIFLLLVIVIAVSSVTGLHTLVTAMEERVSREFDETGPNLIIIPDEDTFGFSYGGVTIPAAGAEPVILTNDSILAVRGIHDGDSIAAVAPKVLGQAFLENGEPFTVVGVDFPYEFKLKQWWTYQGEAPRSKEDLLVGSEAARRLGWTVDQVVIINDVEYKVAAILEEQGSDDDRVVFMQLLEAQSLLGKEDRLSLMEVAAYCSTCPLPDIARQISEALPGTKVTMLAETAAARAKIVDRLSRYALILSVLMLVSGTLIILLTMMSGVNERTAEIGIYRAIGFRQGNVFEILLTEALLLGLVGGILGYGLGIAMADLAAPLVAGVKLPIGPEPQAAFFAIIGAALWAVAAGIYPAVKASRRDPVEALRFI
ncbi:MAG: FtsX-like permease family protein [Clostridia bacterium]|nr:FtsX-like permease family protein [Clostridia bacterium]